MRFTATDTFWSDELKTQYVAGMSYEVREDSDLLRSLVPRWIDEGKVREGGPESKITGTATVK